jgi:predicted permease
MDRRDEIDRELRFHVDERAADLVAAGMSSPEAQRRAQLELGGVAQVREAAREYSERFWVMSLWQDVRYSSRRLIGSPGFMSATILTLALGIAANTAIFTIVNSVLLKPLPFPDADRIVLMANHYPKVGNPGPPGFVHSSVPDYYDRLRTMTVYEEQAMFNDVSITFQMKPVPVQILGMMVTPSFFRLVRVLPTRGRVFEEREGEEANRTRIILSHGLAEEMFGSADAAVGQIVQLSRPYTVVGVMPPGFEFGTPGARFWIPLIFSSSQRTDNFRHSNNWYNVARLKPGATIDQAKAQVDALNASNIEQLPQFKQLLLDAGFHTTVDRFQDVLVRDVRPTLTLLWGGALLLLLIGGVNIANLTLVRSTARAKELATRLALGATRARVARLLIVEGLLPAFVGGSLGLAFGLVILRGLSSMGLDRLPRSHEIHMDGRVIGVAFVIALAAGVLMGAVSFTHFVNMRRSALMDRDGRSGSGGKRARSARHTLVVAQVALTFALLMGAGLLLSSFRNLLTTDLGFTSENVVTGTINTPATRYPTENHVRVFTSRVLEALRHVPGVTSVGGTTVIPLGGLNNNSAILAEGYRTKPGESFVAPLQVVVTPGYFEAMGIRLRRGRYFTDADNVAAPDVVIIDERLARHFWREADPIGKRMYTPNNPGDWLTADQNTRWLTVVGVVSSVRSGDLEGRQDLVGAYYFTASQRVPRTLVLAIRTLSDPAATTRAVRAEIAKLDPMLPWSDVRTMTERTARSLAPRRTAMLTGLSFAIVALFLSALGIYGVLAYVVAQRTREIGIRIALGSTAREVFALVLKEGALLVLAGLVIGLAIAIAMRPVMEDEVYGISVIDPIVVGVVTAIVALVAFVACALPAHRAARLDPVLTLNEQ